MTLDTSYSSKINDLSMQNDGREKETNRSDDDDNDEDIDLVIDHPEKVVPNFPCQGPINTFEMVWHDNRLWDEQKYEVNTHGSITAQEIYLVMQRLWDFLTWPTMPH